MKTAWVRFLPLAVFGLLVSCNSPRRPVTDGSSVMASDSLTQARTLIAKARTLYLNNDIHQAEQFFPRAIALLEKTGPRNELGWAYSHYGGLLTKKGDFSTAQSYLMKAYKIFDTMDSLRALGSVCVNIGNNFRNSGSAADAARYYQMAVEAGTKSGDTINRIGALNNLGLLFRKSHPDSAIMYYRQALALIPANAVTMAKIMGTFNLGNLYVDKKDYGTAKTSFTQVLDYCLAQKNYAGVARAYSGLGAVYKNTGRQALAASYLNRGVQIADSLGDSSLKFGLMAELYALAKERGQYKDAIVLGEKIKAHDDSIFAVEKLVAVERLKIQYQSEKKEMENTLLKTEVASQEQQLHDSWMIIIVILSSLIACLLLSWQMYKLYQKRKQADLERETTLIELREANANIKTLSGLLPICSSCKKIRDDQGYWNQLETFISRHSDAKFSHGICPECYKRDFPEIYKKNYGDGG